MISLTFQDRVSVGKQGNVNTGDTVPVLCLVFHVYKDGGGGDSSHGGALVEGWVGWDNVGAQI